MIPALYNDTAVVKRRVSTGRDPLGNPIYGSPTSGTGWSSIYNNMPARFAFNTKMIRFAKEGERVQPQGVMYYDQQYLLQHEDRVIVTSTGAEYVVTGIATGYLINTVIDHMEATLTLP